MDEQEAMSGPTAPRTLSLPGVPIGDVLVRTPLRPIESDRLVTLEGVQGIFTPIAREDGGIDPEGDRNLQAIIEMLRAQLNQQRQESDQLRAEKAALEQKVAVLTARDQQAEGLRQKVAALESENQELRIAIQRPTRQADDFASAVAHSVDSLQNRMASLTNPVSNFAVREFTIDAKVQIDVSPLGTVEYRFIQPGEEVEPSEISNVSLTIVPIPKADAAGTFTRADFTPMLPVEDIQGIGEAYRKALNAHQIYTVSDLLAAGTRVRGSVELATMLDVDRTRLAEWLSHAQLMTVREIDGRKAEVLYDLGIQSLEQLAAADPAGLAARYSARTQQLDRQTVSPIDTEEVTRWIQAARAFVGSRSPRPAG
jgi:hypothetical protein